MYVRQTYIPIMAGKKTITAKLQSLAIITQQTMNVISLQKKTNII